MAWSVDVSEDEVRAVSSRRLPFEPKGEMADFRAAVRAGLRSLQGRQEHGLVATYGAPDHAFADVENVCLYNIGASNYHHLIAAGIVCGRETSPDSNHHLTYTVGVLPDGSTTRADSLAHVEAPVPLDLHSPAEWWAAIRPRINVALKTTYRGDYSVAVELHGVWRTTTLAGLIKPMMDGLISALHAHDGSMRTELLERLPGRDTGAHTWAQLLDQHCAILGTRRLVRPHGRRIAWNPADERCSAFAIQVVPAEMRSIAAVIRVVV